MNGYIGCHCVRWTHTPTVGYPQPRHRWSDTVFTTFRRSPASETPQPNGRPARRLERTIATMRALVSDVRARTLLMTALLLAGAVHLSASGVPKCNCPMTPTDAPFVEWDLPSPIDTSSGAVTVDVHQSHKARLWFVSRLGDVRLYRFEPGSKLGSDTAKW